MRQGIQTGAVIFAVVSLTFCSFCLRPTPFAADAAPAAAQSLSNPQGDNSVEALIASLDHSSPDVKYEALAKLAALGPKARQALPKLLTMIADDPDPLVRARASQALGEIDTSDETVRDALRDAVRTDHTTVRHAAIQALGKRCDEVFLADVFNGSSARTQMFVAKALGFCPEVTLPGTVGALIGALQKDGRTLRLYAAKALSKAKPDKDQAMSALIEVLQQDPSSVDEDLRREAANALTSLSGRAAREVNRSVLPTLERALDIVSSDMDREIRAHAARIEQDINNIQQNLISKIIQFILQNINFMLPIVFIFLIYAASFLLFIFLPKYIVGLNDSLKHLDVGKSGGLSLRRVLLVRYLSTRPRVLDAWLAPHMPSVRRRFEGSESVRQLGPRIPLPVIVDGRMVETFGPSAVREIFASGFSYALTFGEGGLGKTSLACQIARWAMSADKNQWVAPHPMVPILIDNDIDDTGDREQRLLDALNRRLQEMLDKDTPIPEDFLKALLHSRRILLIVDRFSELSESTRSLIRPASSSFPINAMLITSRAKENFGIGLSLITPVSISTERLSHFLLDYVRSVGREDLLNDEILDSARRNLAALVQGQAITVLLAKLYADQLINALDETADRMAPLPQNIPDLMLAYINFLNRGISDERMPDHQVHKDAKDIAWQCIRNDLRPGAARIEYLLGCLGGDDAEQRLKYMCNKLSLLVVVNPPGDRMRFRLDPIVEYIAAIHVAECTATDLAAWMAFFDDVKGMPNEVGSAPDFLSALHNVCRIYQSEFRLPDFVLNYLECLRPSDAIQPVANGLFLRLDPVPLSEGTSRPGQQRSGRGTGSNP